MLDLVLVSVTGNVIVRDRVIFRDRVRVRVKNSFIY